MFDFFFLKNKYVDVNMNLIYVCLDYFKLFVKKIILNFLFKKNKNKL